MYIFGFSFRAWKFRPCVVCIYKYSWGDSFIIQQPTVDLDSTQLHNKDLYVADSTQLHHKDQRSMYFLILFGLVGLSVSAPQYGPEPVLSKDVQCRTVQTTVWDTEYLEVEEERCTTVYVNQCETLYKRSCVPYEREACTTSQEEECSTILREVCTQQQRTEYQQYTETECTTEYKQDCEYQWEGEGEAKVWVPIPSTCRNTPHETCQEVPRTREHLISVPACNNVPDRVCVTVPRQKCTKIADQKCANEPYEKCAKIPKKNCETEHKKVPNRVSRQVPRKVCGDEETGAEIFQRDLEIEVKNPERTETEDKSKIVFQE